MGTEGQTGSTDSQRLLSKTQGVEGSVSLWRRIRLFGVVLLLLVIGAAVYFETLSHQLAGAVSKLQSSRESIEESRRLLNYIVDLESGHRGYLLTGNLRQLEGYEAADRALPDQIALLESLLEHRPDLIEILAAMKDMLTSKRAEMASVRETFEREGRAAVHQLYSEDLGKYEMDSLRRSARIMEVELQRASVAHRLRVEKLISRQSASTMVTLLFVAFVGIAALLFGSRHFDAMRRQRQLSHELSRSERRNDEKSTFLAHVSHEIRTPMNAIFGFSGLLHDREKDPVNRRYIDAITSSARLLLGIINDLLDLSAIEAGKVGIVRKPTNMRDVIDGVLSLFSQQMAGKHLRLESDISAEIPPTLITDGERVRQMLVNLMGNAIKYTEHGSVKVSARAESGSLPLTATCVLSVTDTGPGIDPGDLERIFEPFSRCVTPSGGAPAGTGLGLSITRQLARAMGGDVSVVSAPGKGSTFTVTLPDLPIATTAAGSQYAGLRLRDLPPLKLLAVDDVALNREVLEAQFLGSPHEINMVDSGAKALEFLRHWKPDAMLIDIRMAGMDGFQLARRLRAAPETRQIRLVAVTASKFKTHSEDIQLFDGVVLKPFSESGLAQELALVMDADVGESHSNEVEDGGQHPGPELIHALRVLLDSRWHSIRETLTISEVRKFAEQVVGLGQRYASAKLRRYGQSLLTAATSFDVARIESLLALFPSTVDAVEGVVWGGAQHER